MTITEILSCAGALIGLAIICTTWIAGAIRDAGDRVSNTLADQGNQDRMQRGELARESYQLSAARARQTPRAPLFGGDEPDEMKAHASERVRTALGMQNTRPPRGS